MSNKPVILTGIRANNDLHIGNYLGALLPIVDMAKTHADEYQINLFVPDLHSFTTPIDHSTLLEGINQNLQVFTAAGLPLDHTNVNIYRQSYIPAHSELTWILDCFAGFGELNRMTQFKDKSARIGNDRISVGLFNYPVLMSADVLLYSTKYVPVGDDQTQHLEFIRDIAERFNAKFGDVFVVPEPVSKQHEFFGKDQGLRIKDLADPTKKMSKSDDSGKGVIFMSDSDEDVDKKIMSATTDSVGKIIYDPEAQPGISNLLELQALFASKPLEEVRSEFEGQEKYGRLKQAVAESIKLFLSDFRTKLANVDHTQIANKLQSSEAAMNMQANKTLLEVQKAVGLR